MEYLDHVLDMVGIQLVVMQHNIPMHQYVINYFREPGIETSRLPHIKIMF